MGLKRDKSGASGHLTPNLATATAHFVDKNFAFTDVSFINLDQTENYY